jgi:hypothetical protein
LLPHFINSTLEVHQWERRDDFFEAVQYDFTTIDWATLERGEASMGSQG